MGPGYTTLTLSHWYGSLAKLLCCGKWKDEDDALCMHRPDPFELQEGRARRLAKHGAKHTPASHDNDDQESLCIDHGLKEYSLHLVGHPDLLLSLFLS